MPAALAKGFERVVLLDDLAFEHFFKEARALLLERLHVGFVADGEALLAVGLFDHDGVGADLAVGELVDEALAFGVDPEAVSAAAVWLNCQPMPMPFSRGQPHGPHWIQSFWTWRAPMADVSRHISDVAPGWFVVSSVSLSFGSWNMRNFTSAEKPP